MSWRRALDERPFDEKVQAFLDDARIELGADALVLVQADARDRELARRVASVAPAGGATLGSVVSDATCDVLWGAAIHAVDLGGRPELRSLGDRVGRAAHVRAHVLDVELPLCQRDSVLVVAGAAPPDAARIAEIASVLEEGLSRARRAQLARTALSAFEHAYDAMEITDGAVRLLHVNRAWEALTGYARHEVVGVPPTFLRAEIGTVHDAAFYRYAEQATTRGDRWSGVMMSKARDGTTILQEAKVASFPDAGAGIAGNIAVRHDLGAREARERALGQMQLEFRAVLAELPQPIAVLRGEDVYFGNPALFALLGRRPEEVLAHSFAEFVAHEEVSLVRMAPTAEARTVHIHRPDGSVRSCELTGAGAVSFEGQVSRIVLARDTTDERVSGEREAHASRLAALGALAASVAHEINNPLAYVLANLEAVSTLSGTAAPVREATAEAIQGARRIQRIVSDLRSFSRLHDEGGALEPIDVERAVSVALNLAANRLRHTTEVRRFHEAGVRARAREAQLVQVLLNLLVNAAQALEEADPAVRAVEVRTMRRGSRVVISVRDSGRGIRTTSLERIFEPFFTTRGSLGGTGLGLSVSRRIVEGFGGTIRASNPEGGGAMFLVELDAMEVRSDVPVPGTASVSSHPPSAPRAADAKPRILVVDDEPAVGRAIARLMREYVVDIAESGVEALEKLRTEPTPDLVLCDLMMPGMTGPELFARVSAEAPAVAERFVFLTGGTFTDEANAFASAHRHRLLAKPFSKAEVRAALALVQGMAQSVSR